MSNKGSNVQYELMIIIMIMIKYNNNTFMLQLQHTSMQVYNFQCIFHICFVRRAGLEVQLLMICPSLCSNTSYNFNIQVQYSF